RCAVERTRKVNTVNACRSTIASTSSASARTALCREYRVPDLDTREFIIPGRQVKNGDERLVVLNRVAESVVASQHGGHPTHVFVHRGRPVKRMLNGAGLPQVRVHDIKHTFGRRLRAA
ncbi:MAG: hypothetical protein ACO3Q7_08400, partial [Steroidobacteraceae bacterium]